MTSSQHGPMILRLITSNSNGVVLVPKTWLNVGPLASSGNSGSEGCERSARRGSGLGLGPTVKAVDHLEPLAFSLFHRLVLEGILALDEL